MLTVGSRGPNITFACPLSLKIFQQPIIQPYHVGSQRILFELTTESAFFSRTTLTPRGRALASSSRFFHLGLSFRTVAGLTFVQ
jgi:hypothetical protein